MDKRLDKARSQMLQVMQDEDELARELAERDVEHVIDCIVQAAKDKKTWTVVATEGEPNGLTDQIVFKHPIRDKYQLALGVLLVRRGKGFGVIFGPSLTKPYYLALTVGCNR